MMDANELRSALKKEKRKMMCESALRALLFGAAAGLFALFVTLLICRLTANRSSVALCLAICLPIGFLAAVVSLFSVFYPTNRRVAARLDECGMAERTVTMLEYADSSTEAAAAQRRDTVARLETGAPKRTVFRMSAKHGTLFGVSVRELLPVMLCGILVIAMTVFPNEMFAVSADSSPKPEEIRQEGIVDKLIEDLREVVKDTENEENFEKQLNDLIDALEQKFKEDGSEYDRISAISETQNKTNKAFEKEFSKDLSEKYTELLEEEQQQMNDLMNEAKKKLMKEDLFSKMHDVVDRAENDAEFEKQLTDRIDELENRFDIDRDAESRIKDINEARKDLDSAFDERKEKSQSEEEQEKLEEERQELDELLKEEKDRIAKEDLFGKIRRVVEKSNNSKGFERTLNEMIDEREKDYEKSKTTKEKIASVLGTMDEMQTAFAAEIESNKETAGYVQALEKEENKINQLLYEELKRLLGDYLSEQLRKIVDESDNEEDFEKKLIERIDSFEEDFGDGDKDAQKNAAIDEMKKDLNEMFGQEIEKQESDEGKRALYEENAKMQAVLDYAKEMLKQSENGKQEQEGEGDKEGEEQDEGDPEDQQGESGDKENNNDNAQDMKDERDTPVYDSEHGKIPFKDVLDEYIKNYNDGKGREEIPEDILAIIDAYFAALQDVKEK